MALYDDDFMLSHFSINLLYSKISLKSLANLMDLFIENTSITRTTNTHEPLLKVKEELIWVKKEKTQMLYFMFQFY